MSRTPRRPGRPPNSRGAFAREQLLSAAVELFGERGVSATTFAMIAKRAGVTPAMLHYYFRSRDELLDSVVGERLARVIAQVWATARAGIAPAVLVSDLIKRLLDTIEVMPWLPSLWIREILSDGGQLRSRVLRQLPRDKMRILSEGIRQKQREGRFNSSVDPDLAVFSIIGLVMLHSAMPRVLADALRRKPPSRDVIFEHIGGLLLDGLRHAPRGR